MADAVLLKALVGKATLGAWHRAPMAPSSSAQPCPRPAPQEEATSGQQTFLTLTPVTNRKDKKNLERKQLVFFVKNWEMGLRGGSRMDSLRTATHSKLSVSTLLLNHYCYQKDK